MVLVPDRMLTHLGLTINTTHLRLDIPPAKLSRIVSNLQALRDADVVAARDLASVVGRIQSLSIAAPAVAAYLRPLYNASAGLDVHGYNDTLISLSPPRIRHAVTSLLRLERMAASHSFAPSRHLTLRVWTDASTRGLGGFAVVDGVEHRWQAPVPSGYMGDDIQVLEALAYLLWMYHHARMLRGRWIDLHVDNESTRYALLKWSSRNELLNDIVQDVFEFTLAFSVRIRVYRVSTHRNVHGDVQSRTVGLGPFADRLDDELRLSIALVKPAFDVVCSFAQEMASRSLTIDLFADEVNAKLPRFYANYFCPAAVGLNALAFDISVDSAGHAELFYAFPPVVMVGPLLAHVVACKAQGIILYPDDATQPWFAEMERVARSSRLLASRASTDVLVKFVQRDKCIPVRTLWGLRMAYVDCR